MEMMSKDLKSEKKLKGVLDFEFLKTINQIRR